jgi:hypothetical protein
VFEGFVGSNFRHPELLNTLRCACPAYAQQGCTLQEGLRLVFVHGATLLQHSLTHRDAEISQ